MMRKFKASTNYGDFYIKDYTFLSAYARVEDYIFKHKNDYFPVINGLWEIKDDEGIVFID